MLKEFPRNLTVAQVQLLLDCWKEFVRRGVELEMMVPKCHITYRQITRALWQGNPTTYFTFLDESLNKSLKQCLRLCHQARFETMGLVKMEALLERPNQRLRLQ